MVWLSSRKVMMDEAREVVATRFLDILASRKTSVRSQSWNCEMKVSEP